MNFQSQNRRNLPDWSHELPLLNVSVRREDATFPWSGRAVREDENFLRVRSRRKRHTDLGVEVLPSPSLRRTSPVADPEIETLRRLAADRALDHRVEICPLLPELARGPSIDPLRY